MYKLAKKNEKFKDTYTFLGFFKTYKWLPSIILVAKASSFFLFLVGSIWNKNTVKKVKGEKSPKFSPLSPKKASSI